MAIAYRHSTALAEDAGAATLRTITKPTGLADGDYVLIIVHDNLTGNPTTTVSPVDAGFSLIRRFLDSNLTTEVYGKYITDAAGESDWQIQYGASSVKLVIFCLAYSGCDPTTPLLTEGGAAEPGVTAAHETPEIDVDVAGCWVVSCACDRNSPIPTTWTGTDTERHDVQSTGSNPCGSMVQDSNGTVSTGLQSRTLTSGTSNGTATMWIGALQPEGGGDGTPVTYEVKIG